ncbi:MAG TPA: ATP-binding cassette domain-containing protein [Chloroflexota bacterium]|nr:ATP-binding cassette domain-containing protein [Chloroflexota bacterium]
MVKPAGGEGMTAGGAAYEVAHLSKRFPGAPRGAPPANDDVSLRIRAGEVFGVFGPNGAGKTTLVRQLAGLLRPTSGTIRLLGHDVVAHPDVVPRFLGYFGQRLAALREHTFREVVLITGVLRGLPTAVARREADALLERFAAGQLAGRRLRTLSGGEQRLAVLLATFAGAPPVVILDEPTNELDPVRRRAAWAYLEELKQTRGTTIVLVTHNLLEAEQVVERVAILDRGRLQALGTPGELKRRVADTVRLEVRLREAAGGQALAAETIARAEAHLATLASAVRLRPGRWELSAPQAEAASLLPRVIELVGLEALDDFRLLTPTMEDVYARFAGRRWESRS